MKNTFHGKVASIKFWVLSLQTSISSRRITKQIKSVERLLYFCSQILILHMERHFRRMKNFSLSIFVKYFPLDDVQNIESLCGK
jgi:hypothetical protein